MPFLFALQTAAGTLTIAGADWGPMTGTMNWLAILMTGLVIGHFAASIAGLLLRPANGRNPFLALALTWPFLALAAMSALAYGLSALG